MKEEHVISEIQTLRKIQKKLVINHQFFILLIFNIQKLPLKILPDLAIQFR
jgi:hypothetical protein